MTADKIIRLWLPDVRHANGIMSDADQGTAIAGIVVIILIVAFLVVFFGSWRR